MQRQEKQTHTVWGGTITDTSLLLTSSPLPITHLLQAIPTLRGLTGVSYVALKSFHHSFQPSEQTAVKYKYNLTCWWHLEPRPKGNGAPKSAGVAVDRVRTSNSSSSRAKILLIKFAFIQYYQLNPPPRWKHHVQKEDTQTSDEWTVEQFTFPFQTRADRFISIQFIKEKK